MAGCITSNWKDIVLGLLKAESSKNLLESVIGSIPLCGEATGQAPAEAGTAKIVVTKSGTKNWPAAEFFNKDGSVEAGSMTGLFAKHYGQTVFEDNICRVYGPTHTDCRAQSTVENFMNRGCIVRGNGDPAPVPTSDMSVAQVDRMFSAWKDKLLAEGRKIKIYPPDHPSLKEATKAIEKAAK